MEATIRRQALAGRRANATSCRSERERAAVVAVGRSEYLQTEPRCHVGPYRRRTRHLGRTSRAERPQSARLARCHRQLPGSTAERQILTRIARQGPTVLGRCRISWNPTVPCCTELIALSLRCTCCAHRVAAIPPTLVAAMHPQSGGSYIRLPRSFARDRNDRPGHGNIHWARRQRHRLKASRSSGGYGRLPATEA